MNPSKNIAAVAVAVGIATFAVNTSTTDAIKLRQVGNIGTDKNSELKKACLDSLRIKAKSKKGLFNEDKLTHEFINVMLSDAKVKFPAAKDLLDRIPGEVMVASRAECDGATGGPSTLTVAMFLEILDKLLDKPQKALLTGEPQITATQLQNADTIRIILNVHVKDHVVLRRPCVPDVCLAVRKQLGDSATPFPSDDDWYVGDITSDSDKSYQCGNIDRDFSDTGIVRVIVTSTRLVVTAVKSGEVFSLPPPPSNIRGAQQAAPIKGLQAAQHSSTENETGETKEDARKRLEKKASEDLASLCDSEKMRALKKSIMNGSQETAEKMKKLELAIADLPKDSREKRKLSYDSERIHAKLLLEFLEKVEMGEATHEGYLALMKPGS